MQSGQRSRRDPRVDVLRGLALLMIFIDHTQSNVLGFVTLHMYGFSDAAELFVILAGFSSMTAYGRAFERDGVRTGLAKIAMRCLRIYLFQIGLLVLTFVMVKEWGKYYDVLIPELVPFLASGKEIVKHGVALGALPAKLDILPLYLVLLGLFPLIHLGMRWSVPLVMAGSATIWLAANLFRGLNFNNWMDGQGWFLNPFAWQFLFVIGAAGTRLLDAHAGQLPRIRWLIWACWAYVLFALLVSAPWASWGIFDFRPIHMDTPSKSSLGPLRLLHILALVYLALSSPRFLAFARRPTVSAINICGRHSLELFSLATILALMGSLLATSFSLGTHWPMQIAINVIGLGAMIVLAEALEMPRKRREAAAHPVKDSIFPA